MADYASSSHKERWIMTPKTLTKKRLELNQRASNALSRKGSTKVDFLSDGTLPSIEQLEKEGLDSTENPSSEPISQVGSVSTPANETAPGPLPKPVTVEEELLLCKFYESKIQSICRAFGFPHKIQATAILYFKRFFLHWSVMEIDAKNIMLTCIYLACKIEESYVSAEEFGKGTQQKSEVVLQHELPLLQTLQFDLIVFSPYRALEGFVIDIRNFLKSLANSPSGQDIDNLKNQAYAIADSAMRTNLPLTFSPSQIALCCLYISNLHKNAFDFQKYLHNVIKRKGKNGGEKGEECILDVMEMIKEIKKIIDEEGRLVMEEDVKPIDRKIKYCKNPNLLKIEDQRKKDKKERRSKRASVEEKGVQIPDIFPIDENVSQEHKRRKSHGETVL